MKLTKMMWRWATNPRRPGGLWFFLRSLVFVVLFLPFFTLDLMLVIPLIVVGSGKVPESRRYYVDPMKGEY